MPTRPPYKTPTIPARPCRARSSQSCPLTNIKRYPHNDLVRAAAPHRAIIDFLPPVCSSLPHIIVGKAPVSTAPALLQFCGFCFVEAVLSATQARLNLEVVTVDVRDLA